MVVHPIIMSGWSWSVRAIQDGRKTQTRRAVALGNSYIDGMWVQRGEFAGVPVKEFWAALRFEDAYPDGGPSPAGNPGPYLHVPYPHEGSVHRIYPKWQVGDLLWVKEVWRVERVLDSTAPANFDQHYPTDYKADDGEFWMHKAFAGRWRSPIHMPRRFSRLTLRLTDVRVQRVQEISGPDACAEGIRFDGLGDGPPMRGNQWRETIDAFSNLWDSINYKRAPWESNPHVWALSFSVIRQNIDDVLREDA